MQAVIACAHDQKLQAGPPPHYLLLQILHTRVWMREVGQPPLSRLLPAVELQEIVLRRRQI